MIASSWRKTRSMSGSCPSSERVLTAGRLKFAQGQFFGQRRLWLWCDLCSLPTTGTEWGAFPSKLQRFAALFMAQQETANLKAWRLSRYHLEILSRPHSHTQSTTQAKLTHRSLTHKRRPSKVQRNTRELTHSKNRFKKSSKFMVVGGVSIEIPSDARHAFAPAGLTMVTSSRVVPKYCEHRHTAAIAAVEA
jgi:hypothetical protein